MDKLQSRNVEYAFKVNLVALVKVHARCRPQGGS